ncbi:hypothetical protein A2U01_0092561, partial [Trifolium medium]|nr:hypothetical protein [Trifolium medium]
ALAERAVVRGSDELADPRQYSPVGGFSAVLFRCFSPGLLSEKA